MDLTKQTETSDSEGELDTQRDEIYAGLSVQKDSAPFMLRLFAYCVDLGIAGSIMYLGSVIIGLICMLMWGLLTAAFNGMGLGDKSPLIAGFISALIFLLAVMAIHHVYFIYQEKKSGTTFGKKMFGLMVSSEDHTPLTTGQCVMREATRVFEAGMIIPGLLAINLRKDRKRLGDLLSKTQVSWSKAKEADKYFLYLTQDEFVDLLQQVKIKGLNQEKASSFLVFAFPAFITKRLRPAEIESQVIRDFIEEHLSTNPDTDLSYEKSQRLMAELCHQIVNGHESTQDRIRQELTKAS